MGNNIADMGEEGSIAEFKVTNVGGSATEWQLSGGNPALSFGPSSGELGPAETVSIVVNLDREISEEGELGTELSLTWGDGDLDLFVQWMHNVNPIIIGPKASPSTVFAGGECTPSKTTVTVKVRETSELAEVYVRWSDGSTTHETPMTQEDEEVWKAVIGPFPAAVDPNTKVTAIDIHENAGGAPFALTVAPCV